jgi:hypothetical protein
MGGCEVRGIFLDCVRRLLLSIIPWGRSFPYKRVFFVYSERPVQISFSFVTYGKFGSVATLIENGITPLA